MTALLGDHILADPMRLDQRQRRVNARGQPRHLSLTAALARQLLRAVQIPALGAVRAFAVLMRLMPLGLSQPAPPAHCASAQSHAMRDHPASVARKGSGASRVRMLSPVVSAAHSAAGM